MDPNAVTLRRQGYGENKSKFLFKGEIHKKNQEYKKKTREHEIPRTRNQSNKETARQSGKITRFKVQRKKNKVQIKHQKTRN